MKKINLTQALCNRTYRNVKNYKNDVILDLKIIKENINNTFLWLTRKNGTLLVPLNNILKSGKEVIEYYLENDETVKCYLLNASLIKNETEKKRIYNFNDITIDNKNNIYGDIKKISIDYCKKLIQ